MGDFNRHVVYFFRPAFEAVVKGLHKSDLSEFLGFWLRIIAWARDSGREKVKARRRQIVRAKLCSTRGIGIELGAGSADGAANHIPNDEAVHSLRAGHDIRA